MFKFLGKAFALLVLSIFFISSAQARDYKEGLDYEIRATNKTVEPEIREFFSFFCSHCFAMEKPFSQMAEFFKGKAKFIVNPVGLIGGDVGVESQKAYAVAINLEIEDELKEEIECPECHNKIELDWDGEDDDCCSGGCCGCGHHDECGCDEDEEDSDTDSEEKDDNDDDM